MLYHSIKNLKSFPSNSDQAVSNQHFISHQLTQTSLKEKSKANILPQTGNDQNSGSILGFAFAALASILGLTDLKKKREK
ncbi:LPXTG cell wall anchor domain-containing protein [Limosilactobacillus reuteri]|uniref:LPXTG cell wall anchor domain-containing protein n=1 Tax=Limosilactobacillus reuteri TaxID=1598 RepID=UPI00177E9B2A|nr:LPXTG cell wall anchor domain-containing protein [Limosilactobacillus reuteri]